MARKFKDQKMAGKIKHTNGTDFNTDETHIHSPLPLPLRDHPRPVTLTNNHSPKTTFLDTDTRGMTQRGG